MANRVVRVNVEKIREFANEKNTTVKQIEAEAGIANGAIGKWVSCDARLDKLYRVADVLGTSIENLIEKV